MIGSHMPREFIGTMGMEIDRKDGLAYLAAWLIDIKDKAATARRERPEVRAVRDGSQRAQSRVEAVERIPLRLSHCQPGF